MIALLFALRVMTQGPDTNAAMPVRVRAMLDAMPLPHPGEVSVVTRFTRDTVWVGEQVELVTVAWFPRTLRERLRQRPRIRPPNLLGVWSAHNQLEQREIETRIIGHQLYDVYLSYQTVFPLAGGRIEAPPAVLTYLLPVSASYFAPEDQKSVSSGTAVLYARPIPATLTGALGNGPTARNLRATWHAPATGLQAGAPAIVDLVVSGDGNLTLWPAPEVPWPAGAHVYPEPTTEHQRPQVDAITGEKHFRFTLVVDSAGVYQLPSVDYPYFDPATRDVTPVTATAVSLAVLPRAAEARPTGALPVTPGLDEPVASRVVRTGWPVLAVLGLLPIALMIRRRPARRRTPVAPADDPEQALRSALGTPVDAGPDHVVAALRRRGIARADAEHVHRWLEASSRRRYGPEPTSPPEPPPVLQRILLRLRTGAMLVVLVIIASRSVAARQSGGVSRYEAGDYPGAARVFSTSVAAEPRAEGAWRNLGAARWMMGDDAGAAAAWLVALSIAPRDPLLRTEWRAASTIPPDVRARAPAVPFSRDELLLIAWASWLVACVFQLLHRKIVSLPCFAVAAIAVGIAAVRTRSTSRADAIITANTDVRISPHPATPVLGQLTTWSIVTVRTESAGWALVDGGAAPAGGITATVSGWVPMTALARLGPLD